MKFKVNDSQRITIQQFVSLCSESLIFRIPNTLFEEQTRFTRRILHMNFLLNRQTELTQFILFISSFVMGKGIRNSFQEFSSKE